MVERDGNLVRVRLSQSVERLLAVKGDVEPGSRSVLASGY